jgi:hypothetical protein
LQLYRDATPLTLKGCRGEGGKAALEIGSNGGIYTPRA